MQDNVIDLAWHQREHESRASLCYTVFDVNESECLGCVYMNPPRKLGYDVEVFYWRRSGSKYSGLELQLRAAIEDWLNSAFPFTNVVFPGATQTGMTTHR